MKRSCSYCGKIHDSKYICTGKRQAEAFKKAGNNAQDTFRWSRQWKKKAAEIKERDHYMCQCCLRLYPGTVYQYQYKELSVHHIIPIVEDSKRKLDNYNLITLCRYHHDMAEKKSIQRAGLLLIAKEQEEKILSQYGKIKDIDVY